MSFQLIGLPHERFEPLFFLDDGELLRRGMRRVLAEEPGLPCRVGLEEAAVGDELLLLPFAHQPANSPYRSSGPIFVRRGARQRVLPVDTVSPYVTNRLMSVRAYDKGHSIVDAAVCEGKVVADELRGLFAQDAVEYIHLHNARRGCYSCLVLRA